MSRIIFLLCVLIKTISSENELCSALNDKLNQYGIQITNIRRDFLGLRICEDLIDDLCCPQTHEEDFQNVTTMELNHLFEFYSKDFYQSLHHTIRQLNGQFFDSIEYIFFFFFLLETIHQLIEYSRNETHEILQTTFAISYRSSIDIFYNQFLEINSRNYQHEIKHLVEEFFRNLLRMNFEEHHSIKPSRQSAYLTCLWRNHPFGNRPNLLAKKLEIYWRKVSHLHELLKLTIELIQVISTVCQSIISNRSRVMIDLLWKSRLSSNTDTHTYQVRSNVIVCLKLQKSRAYTHTRKELTRPCIIKV